MRVGIVVALLVIGMRVVFFAAPVGAQDLSCAYQTQFIVEYERQAEEMVNGLYNAIQNSNFNQMSLYSGLLSIGAVLVREYVNCPDVLERLEQYEKLAYWGLLIVAINNDNNLVRGINAAPEADVVQGIANEMVKAYSELMLQPSFRQRS